MSLKDKLYVSQLRRLNSRFERDLSELLLLTFFLGLATYMFYGSFEFALVSQWFPQMTSITVIVGTVLLLTKNFLPGVIRRVVDADPSFMGDPEPTGEFETKIDEDVDEAEVEDAIDPGTLVVLTPLLMLLYVLTSYYFGMLWVSPIFVVLYLVLTKQRWYTIVSMSIISILLVYLFIWALNIDLHTGVWLPDGLGLLEGLGLA